MSRSLATGVGSAPRAVLSTGLLGATIPHREAQMMNRRAFVAGLAAVSPRRLQVVVVDDDILLGPVHAALKAAP